MALASITDWVKANIELLLWLLALPALYFMPEEAGHFTLCPLGAMGVSWCPGCGLGHAIHYLLHLQWEQSLHHHYLGPFALALIVYRIFRILIHNFKIKQPHHG